LLTERLEKRVDEGCYCGTFKEDNEYGEEQQNEYQRNKEQLLFLQRELKEFFDPSHCCILP
jgi:hypothetical protein